MKPTPHSIVWLEALQKALVSRYIFEPLAHTVTLYTLMTPGEDDSTLNPSEIMVNAPNGEVLSLDQALDALMDAHGRHIVNLAQNNIVGLSCSGTNVVITDPLNFVIFLTNNDYELNKISNGSDSEGTVYLSEESAFNALAKQGNRDISRLRVQGVNAPEFRQLLDFFMRIDFEKSDIELNTWIC